MPPRTPRTFGPLPAGALQGVDTSVRSSQLGGASVNRGVNTNLRDAQKATARLAEEVQA